MCNTPYANMAHNSVVARDELNETRGHFLKQNTEAQLASLSYNSFRATTERSAIFA